MSKLVLKREDLRKALQKTSRIAGSSANLDHMRAYYFVNKEDGLTLASSDLRLTLFAKLRAVSVDADLPIFAVDSKRLDELVKLAEEEIELEPTDSVVRIKTGSYTTSWALKSTEMFDHDVSEGEWVEEWNVGEFKFALDSLLAVSDRTHVIQDSNNNIYLDGERAYCFDGANLALVPFKTAERYVLTNDIGKQLKLLAEGTRLKVKRTNDGSVVVIQTESDLFSFRDPIYEQSYDISEITAGIEDDAVIALTKDSLLRTLKRMTLISSDKDERDMDAELLIEGNNSATLSLSTYSSGEQSTDALKIKRASAKTTSHIKFLTNLDDIIMMVSSVPSDVVVLKFQRSPLSGNLLSVLDEGKRFVGYISYMEN